MMCIFCGGGFEQSKTEYIEKNGSMVVLIKNVPCDECMQCGETYFDSKTVKAIENILEGIQPISSEITLSVIDYTKSAA
ncbi:MAG: type II toxin-antitoxin system MqsA family antitoxin [Oscillospiraceae bacterium]|nr:type II toxin-antitoxin system MqsA family antitoxin [Oscillospiraceae bacterium]